MSADVATKTAKFYARSALEEGELLATPFVLQKGHQLADDKLGLVGALQSKQDPVAQVVAPTTAEEQAKDSFVDLAHATLDLLALVDARPP